MADRHRLTGGMLLLTVLGALLMLPPLVYVFNQPQTIFGIPQIVFYLFVVWLLLILGTALMAHARPHKPQKGDAPGGEG
ncbi:MAG: hypothetical protein ABS76_13225 [Pelagibacterium sp. SCN 64-44]|nr:MAG: hypothetical protein ABS76_13225 [Pelagibacterium sp. SCN 64-44]